MRQVRTCWMLSRLKYTIRARHAKFEIARTAGICQSSVMDKETVITVLREHADELRAAGLVHLRVFGSVARGEDREGSDVDILVERYGTMTFIDLFRLEDELTALLGCTVEVATGLKPHAMASAVRDLRIL